MTPEETVKPKQTRKAKEQHVCHISDECKYEHQSIHKAVCRDLETTEHIDGNRYCLLHLPTKEKDIEKFGQVFQERLHEHDDAIAKIEADFLYNKDKQDEAKRGQGINYDFRYVWFPLSINFSKKTFSGKSDFKSATFSGYADFSSATFSGYADFSSATFSGYASFNWATFSGYADFSSATFSDYASFNWATFIGIAAFRSATFSDYAAFRSTNFRGKTSFEWANFRGKTSFGWAIFSDSANFSSASFSDDPYFRSANFSGNADFSSATFAGETSFSFTVFSKEKSTNFENANFAKDTFFDFTEFNNDASFNSVIFGSDSDVLFRKTLFAGKTDFRYCTAEGYMRFSNLRQGKQNKFDFEDATFDKATRVSFHTLRLCPNWFVNVDSRKFVFTDVTWDNLSSDYRNKNIQRELESLQARAIDEQKKRLLEIAARQLAVNAEENNRYEEAAKFRYMAMETKRLEETKQLSFSRFLIWLYKWTSGYGENWTLAASVLIGVLFIFGYLYASPLSAFDYGKEGKPPSADTFAQNVCDKVRIVGDPQMNVCEGILHSLSVATFQRPEPKANDVLTKLFVVLEVIFAPLQAALLALAIRRKFIR
jgi:hypothetical protein